MTTFEVKTDLPVEIQNEIDRISAIPSGQRSVSEAAFLTSRSVYLTNEIIRKDDAGLILEASGNTLPTSYSGFRKGAEFYKKDAVGNSKYENVGDETSATWELLSSAESSTPVNAVAATGVITSDNTEIADGDTVTIGGRVYTFRDTLAQVDDVKRHGTTADTTLANLRAAINLTGTEGVEYFAGQTINADVTCSAVAAHAVTLTAKTKGVIGNLITLVKSAAHLTLSGLSAGKLSGGVDGTVGGAGEERYDSSYKYIAVAANTIADANWRRISLGSAY